MEHLALYIGAGLDLKLIKSIPQIKNFIYIDSQPNSEFGIEEYWQRDPSYIFNCFCPNYGPLVNDYFKPQFVTDLKKTAYIENMTLVTEEVNKKLTFNYKDQTIQYFINLSIPEHIDIIKNDIQNFNHLIISGFDPHSSILKYTEKPITFWGNINTIYNTPIYNNCLSVNNNKDTILYRLNYESLFEKNFNKFYFIENNTRISCFRYWENYFIFSKHIINISK